MNKYISIITLYFSNMVQNTGLESMKLRRIYEIEVEGDFITD